MNSCDNTCIQSILSHKASIQLDIIDAPFRECFNICFEMVLGARIVHACDIGYVCVHAKFKAQGVYLKIWRFIITKPIFILKRIQFKYFDATRNSRGDKSRNRKLVAAKIKIKELKKNVIFIYWMTENQLVWITAHCLR